MNWLKRLIHKLQGCSGHVVTRWQQGYYYVEFKCQKCGNVIGIHKGYTNSTHPSNVPDTEWEE